MMRIFANKATKLLFAGIISIYVIAVILYEAVFYMQNNKLSFLGFLFMTGMSVLMMTICFLYVKVQEKKIEKASFCIKAFLEGDTSARIDCDEEGELYRLFHNINMLGAVCNASLEKEASEKENMKNTILDISHQLKTPIAALNVYNGLLQEDELESEEIKQFASLSEMELDRMENLIQNLLKLAKFDAGSITFDKRNENVAEIIKDVWLHFQYRARNEEKELRICGDDKVLLFCDRSWIMEAVENLVKNALDHTKAGDYVSIGWKKLTQNVVQIVIEDNGCGIHEEDIYHIFKRFYRSRFSKDKQGIGLGLPLAKAIIEAHHGTIEVDSKLDHGTIFKIQFLQNPTIL